MPLTRIHSDQADLVAPLFDAYRQFYRQPSDLEGARRYLYERLKRNEAVIFAEIEDGRALGFTLLYPSYSSVSMKFIWILNDLFVVPDARRRGVATRLLAAARDHAEKTGAARLLLSTGVENKSAQALYEREGWQPDPGYLQYKFDIQAGSDNGTQLRGGNPDQSGES